MTVNNRLKINLFGRPQMLLELMSLKTAVQLLSVFKDFKHLFNKYCIRVSPPPFKLVFFFRLITELVIQIFKTFFFARKEVLISAIIQKHEKKRNITTPVTSFQLVKYAKKKKKMEKRGKK